MTFYGFQVVCHDEYILGVRTNKGDRTEALKRHLKLERGQWDWYETGTIEARNIEEAINKIRSNDWNYEKVDSLGNREICEV